MVRIPSLTMSSGRHATPVLDRKDDTAERSTTELKPAKPARRELIAPVARPRGSMLATLSLLLGVASAGAVATGVLAVPGVAVGLFTTLLATVGIAATARPHVTGRISALFGLLLALAAVIVGLLALGNAISWPDPDVNQVTRLADWLDGQFSWLKR